MIARIKKELCSPVNGEVVGPYFHLYKVKDDGTEELIESFDGDIKAAARRAEQIVDLEALDIAYEENPNCFSSSVLFPPNYCNVRSNTPGVFKPVEVDSYEGKVTRVNEDFVAIHYKDSNFDSYNNHMLYVKPGKWKIDDEVEILIWPKIKS